ncbi:hypothetical protein MRX96_014692 [Rhipicephalus microplus]
MTLSRVVERQKVRGRSWIYIASSCARGYAVEGCVPFVRPELRGGQTAALDSNAQGFSWVRRSGPCVFARRRSSLRRALVKLKEVYPCKDFDVRRITKLSPVESVTFCTVARASETCELIGGAHVTLGNLKVAIWVQRLRDDGLESRAARPSSSRLRSRRVKRSKGLRVSFLSRVKTRGAGVPTRVVSPRDNNDETLL